MKKNPRLYECVKMLRIGKEVAVRSRKNRKHQELMSASIYRRQHPIGGQSALSGSANSHPVCRCAHTFLIGGR